MPTQTTAEAMAILKATRRELIDQARVIADELINRDGETDIRQVRDTMADRGLLPEDVRDFWLGVVFNCRRYEWTGQFIAQPTHTRFSKNKHSPDPIRVWRAA